MKQNMGKTDRYIRVVLGFVIIAAGIYTNSGWGALGIVPIINAFTGLCPVYKLLGVDTGHA